MRLMPLDDARQVLAHIEPRTQTELPRFIAGPRVVATSANRDGSRTLVFECLDSANDQIWPVPVTLAPPFTQESVPRCAAEALELANMIARAVFN